MTQKQSYSMDEVSILMEEHIEKSADELISELQANWKKQESTEYV